MIVLVSWLLIGIAFVGGISGLYYITDGPEALFGWYIVGASVGVLTFAAALEGLQRMVEALQGIRQELAGSNTTGEPN